MQMATERHFYYHGKEGYEEERNNCHWCQIRSFPTHSTLPVTVVNEQDSEVLPDDFRFIKNVVLGEGVEQAGDSFRSGCSCNDAAECQFSGCHCLADLEEDNSSDDEYDPFGDRIDDMDIDRSRRKAYAYHAHGAKAGLLRSKFHNSKMPIYECHQSCACSVDCPNRVVERGRTIPLEIFRTEDRGWGVRSPVSIKKGQFVDRYLGEIITSREADNRRKESAISQRKDVYLFALDKFTDPNSLDPRLKGPSLEVDGEFMSGPTRFVNHSCEPNMRIFARVGDHADKHIHDLALFAIKDIPRGEELTFDYVDGVSHDGQDLEAKSHMTPCLCGSKSCPSETSFLSDSRTGAASSTGSVTSSDGNSLEAHHVGEKNNTSSTDFGTSNFVRSDSAASPYFYYDCLTVQACRVLRRSRRVRRALVLRQISQGRANPSEVWCNDKSCDREVQIFSNPLIHLADFATSRERLPVAVYFKDFADAMITKFFDIRDINAKDHRTRGLLSFIDSPPVRAAFWHFIRGYDGREYKLSNEDFQKALIKARPVFLDMMFGVKTAARARLTHSYINPQPQVYDKWGLQQLILRFLICSEMWRQQKTPRSKNWKIGSREGVGDFMTAMLFHYKLMWQQGCFDTDFIHTDHVWDRVWELWLCKYPFEDPNEVVDGGLFQLRDHIEKTEQEVLNDVGYLGGIGQNDETFNPIQ
ncbi:histone-lysine n- h3 lysine-9 specific dim-5 [Fusarium longipes]|uniref:Histone-lysine n-h3 lysine-9 specific dim-5 n=1 Tax=Fusarium longipes TaxID=694270 RepID=A0A395S2G3_9HYPO|nr:histone-lysine n- h3 lysine-9 specific dim-5 [Fusarium longipes]